MKIAYAIQMSILQQGGVEVLVRSLIENCASENEVYLVSNDSHDQLAQEPWAQRLSGHFNAPPDAITKAWGLRLIDWLKQHEINLIHFHLPGTFAWKIRSWTHCPIPIVARAGLAVVTTNHQAMDLFDRKSVFWLRWMKAIQLLPCKYRQLAAVRYEVSVSRHDLAVSCRDFPRANEKLIQIYHARLNVNQAESPKEDNHTILNVATIAFRKGQHLLVEAFARISMRFPNWKLVLVGSPAEKACVEQIQQIIKTNNLTDRVLLVGAVEDPTTHYHNSAIYVQPSLLEGLGLSLQEAMFHGIACIGSETGGIPELIESPQVGLLFPSGNIAALAEAISTLIENPTTRRTLGKAARVSILDRGMTREAMCESYRELHHEALRLSMPPVAACS